MWHAPNAEGAVSGALGSGEDDPAVVSAGP